MTPELTYFLKVNVAIVLFYTFYRSCCTQDTFLHSRRFVLLSFFAVAWLYPNINLNAWFQDEAPIQGLAVIYAQSFSLGASAPQVADSFSWSDFLINAGILVYEVGVAILLLKLLIQLGALVRLALHSTPINGEQSDQYFTKKVRIGEKITAPFSFFGWIFLPTSLWEHREGEEYAQVMAHELAHVRGFHSIDILWTELSCIACWINPFAWLLQREVRHNLEYLADRQVLNENHDARSYQYHLLREAQHLPAAATLYTNFNVLPIKKRVLMMNKPQTQKIRRTKYFLLLPLVAVLMLFSHIEVVARNTQSVYTHLAETLLNEPSQSIPALENGNAEASLAILTNKEVQSVPAQQNKKTSGSPLLVLNGKEVQLSANQQKSLHLSTATKADLAAFFGAEIADIKSITILKGQAATKLWGKKAINGVVQVQLDKDQPLEKVDESPLWKGGASEMYKFMNANLKYPAEAQAQGFQGKVIVRFVVEIDGSISHALVVRSLCPSLDAEALRVLKLMGASNNWQPAKMSGKLARAWYVMPFSFKLD